MVVDSGTREAIRDGVIFAVDVANAPVGAALGEEIYVKKCEKICKF